MTDHDKPFRNVADALRKMREDSESFQALRQPYIDHYDAATTEMFRLALRMSDDSNEYRTLTPPPIDPAPVIHRFDLTDDTVSISMSEDGITWDGEMPRDQFEFVRRVVIEQLALESDLIQSIADGDKDAEDEPPYNRHDDNIASGGYGHEVAAWLRSKKGGE